MPIAITINPIIREIAFKPEAPNSFTMKCDPFKIRKVIKQTPKIARTATVFSEVKVYSSYSPIKRDMEPGPASIGIARGVKETDSFW